jgi:hypothetical protein
LPVGNFSAGISFKSKILYDLNFVSKIVRLPMHTKKILFLIILSFITTCQATQNSPNWSPSVDISSNDTTTAFNDFYSRQVLGVDENSNAFAIWISQANEVLASRFDAATQTWSSDVTIGNAPAETPALSVTKDGKAIAVWLNPNDGNIYYNVYDGGWNSPGIVPFVFPSGTTNILNSRPSIGVDNLGHAIIVCSTTFSSSTSVDFQAITSLIFDFSSMMWGLWTGASDSQVVYIDITAHTNDDLESPIIAVNDDGYAFVVYRYDQVSGSVYNIASVEYLPSTGWASFYEVVSQIAFGSRQLIDPIVAIDSNHNAFAIWIYLDPNADNYHVYGSYRPASGTWSTEMTLVSNNSLSASLFPPTNNATFYLTDFAFDMNGNGVGVWPGNPNTVVAGIFDASSQSIISSMTISNQPAALPRIAVQANGDAWATWSEIILSASSANTLAAKFTKSSDSWESPPETLSTRTINIFSNASGFSGSDVATNGIGCYFADWPSSDSPTGPFFLQASNTCFFPPSPSSLQPPQNLQACQRKNRFLTQTEYYNVITWTPSPSSNVQGYKIFRNGCLIANLRSDCFQYKDHNQCKCVRTIYQVVTVDTKGNTSAAAVFVLP